MHPSRLRSGPSQSRPHTDASPGSARSPGLRVYRATPSPPEYPYTRLYGDLFVKPSPLLTSSVSDSRCCGQYIQKIRGSPLSRATLAPRPCIRLDPCGIPTMKQPFASAARLRGDGPILLAASEPTVCPGHRHLGSSTAIRENPSGRRTACSSFLADRLSPAAATRTRPGFRRP
jgi:hypothetical protein